MCNVVFGRSALKCNGLHLHLTFLKRDASPICHSKWQMRETLDGFLPLLSPLTYKTLKGEKGRTGAAERAGTGGALGLSPDI